METVLSTSNLTKKYGTTLAADNVCINVHRGDVYGLIGRNGAGKTTILKMIGGFIRPTKGTFSLFGREDIDKCDALTKVGTLIESPGLHTSLSAYSNIEMKCICAGINYDEKYIMDLLELVGLSSVAHKKCGGFSLGMKQRLGIALALVGEPELLVLDEPINGLDPQGIAEVRETLIHLHKERGITIIISSHILEELSKIVTVYGIIDRGRIIKEITSEELEHECTDRVEIAMDEAQKGMEIITKLGYDALLSDGKIEINGATDKTPEIIKALCDASVPPRTVEIKGRSIEDFYFSLVGGEDRA